MGEVVILALYILQAAMVTFGGLAAYEREWTLVSLFALAAVACGFLAGSIT